MNHSTLELKREKCWQTNREYFDFFVNGTSLGKFFNEGVDIGCLGWGPPEHEKLIIGQLLLNEIPEPESGRVPIYVCSECGDLGCGAVTVRIEEKEGNFIWSDFAYENNYEGTVELYPSVGPFYFNKISYSAILNKREKEIDQA